MGGGGLVSMGGAGLVSMGGAGLVSMGGAGLVSMGGAGLVSTGGAGLVSMGGAGLVSMGGPGLVSMGGAELVSMGGAGLVSMGGAGIVSICGAGPVRICGWGPLVPLLSPNPLTSPFSSTPPLLFFLHSMHLPAHLSPQLHPPRPLTTPPQLHLSGHSTATHQSLHAIPLRGAVPASSPQAGGKHLLCFCGPLPRRGTA